MPTTYDITAPNGKTYRMEANEGVSQEQALEAFQRLPEEEWEAYEYNDTSTVQSPVTVPTKQTETPAPVEQIPSINNTLNAFDVQSGTTKRVTREIANNPKVTSLAESLWAQGVRDPEVYSKNLSAVAGKPITVTAEDLAVVRKRDAYYKAKGVKAPGLFTYTEPTGEEDPERPDTLTGVAGQAAARSVANIYNSGVGAVALGADLVGADETSDALLEDYIENNAKIAYHYGRPVRTDEVEDLESAAMFAADVFGELAPQLVGSFGLGYLGKEAATYSIRKGAQELIEAKVQQGVAREVAEQQVLNSLKKRAIIGAAAGASSNSIVQETGSTFGTTYEQTGEKAPLSSLAAGVVSGSLDALLPLTVLNKLGGGRLINEFKRNFLARAAKEGGKGFALEGGTEALQEFITTLPKSVVTGESPFSQETFDQMFEAFWRGGLGGGGVNVAVEGANTVRTAGPQSPAPRYTGEPIVVPEGKKGTKAYKQQLGQAQDRVIEQVNSLTEGWTNAPDIEVYDNFSKLEGVDNTAIGVYSSKTLEDGTTVPVIKINTEAVIERAKTRDVSPESVVEAVTFHEGLGHHGLTSLFREDLDQFLADVYNNGSEQFQDAVDSWLRKNPNAYSQFDEGQRLVLATEEVMAEWSEGGPIARTFYDNVANYIKDFARTRLGMNLKYTEREVKAYLAVAHERTMSGEKIGATPTTTKNAGGDRIRLTRKFPGEEGGNVVGPADRAAKTFLNELGVFTHSELRKMSAEEAIKRAERLGVDDEWLSYYNDAYLRAYGNDVPNTPQPDMSKYMPKAKYMAGDDERTPDTYSAGFKRPKQDERSKAESRKQFWKNKENPNWNPNDPNGLPSNDKYMRGDSPIDPDQLTADDLIEAKNVLDILNRLEYTPKVVSPDQLEAEAIARNLPPSDVTRLVGIEPGKLMKRLFLYDFAATKLSDRAAKIKADIDANGLTQEKQLAYIEATVKLSDLTAQIFDFQAEIGRTLAANRRVNFSRKRVRDLKKVLEEYGLEALADPETFMKYMATIEEQTAAGKARKAGTDLISIINIPRAIMSSADLSAPLRQGIVFIGYKEFWLSFLKMFSLIGKNGGTNYQFLMKKIATHPNYELMQKARLQFSSLDGELSSREEDFQTELARKIPGFGRIVKASEQAYAGFLNKLRADMFNRFVSEYEGAGVTLDEEGLKGLGQFINAATGRAELPQFLRPSATVLNATFFSARLMYSRVQMLNPMFYAQLPAPVRKSAGKAMLRFGAIALMVNAALNLLWPDEVETEVDPRSSEFMKVKVGNTRFDLGGGFNQYLILGARTSTWLYNQSLGLTERLSDYDMTEYRVSNKKTSAGDFQEFGAEEITQDSYLSVLGDFFRSKLSPQASYVIDAMAEKDYIGRPFTIEGSLASRLVPMTASSLYDAYKEDSPVPMPVLFGSALFGVGVNTYTSPSMDPKRELEAPSSFQMKDLEDGSNDFIVAKDGEVTLKKAARDRWTETLNNYYGPYVEEVAAEEGVKFEEADDETKKDIIKEALKRTRAAAKKDMMFELGLSDE